MPDPSITPAVIGLVGVFFGGAITAGANFILAVRKERRDEARAAKDQRNELTLAARLVWDELGLLFVVLDKAAIFDRRVPTDAQKLGTKMWSEYAPVLAAGLPYQDWKCIAGGYQTLVYYGLKAYQEPAHQLEQRELDELELVAKAVKEALQAVARYLGDDDA